MKKLLAVFLILTMCLCVLTACFDESADTGADNGTNDNGTNDSGTNDSGTNDNGGNGNTNDGNTDPDDYTPSGDDIFEIVDPTVTPNIYPKKQQGERITEETFNAIINKTHTNFTYYEIGAYEGRSFMMVCAVDGNKMMSTCYENDVFADRYGTFEVDGTLYSMDYDKDAKKWKVQYEVTADRNYYPIDSIPCSFADLAFDEETGEYSAQVDEDGVSVTILLRFKANELIYACAKAEQGEQAMIDEFFINSINTTKLSAPSKDDVVFNNDSMGDSSSDNIVIKPADPNGSTSDKEDVKPNDKEDGKDENKEEVKPNDRPEDKPEIDDPEHEYDKDGNGVPDADFNGDGRIDKNDFPEGYYPGSSENNQGSSGSTDDEKVETNDKVETGDPLEGERFEEELRREAERYLSSIPKLPRGLEISEDDWNSMKSDPPTNYTYSRQMTVNGKDCFEITMLNGREFMRVEIVDGTIIRKWCGRMENGRMVGYEYNFSKRMWERVNSSLSSDYPIATAPFELSDFTFDRKSGAYSITMTEGNMSATISLYFEHGTLSRLDQTNGSDSMISYFYDYGKTEIKFPKDEEIDESSSSNGPSYGYTDQFGPDYNGDGSVSGGIITNNPNGSYNVSVNGEVNGEVYFVQTVLPENNASSTEEFYTFSDATGNANATVSYHSFNTK